MKFMATTADMILVTGADFTHTNSLLQLLASVERHEPGMRVMIYDLGMTQRELRRIEKQYRRYQIRKFDYGRYPAHFFIRVNAGEYAWKPAIVWQLLCEMQSPVCWMDAGNVLIEDLSRIRAALSRAGFYSPRSGGTVNDWTHPKMLEFFGLNARLGGRQREPERRLRRLRSRIRQGAGAGQKVERRGVAKVLHRAGGIRSLEPPPGSGLADGAGPCRRVGRCQRPRLSGILDPAGPSEARDHARDSPDRRSSGLDDHGSSPAPEIPILTRADRAARTKEHG
jgi:hypothetical protein